MTKNNSNDKVVVKKKYYESGALLAEIPSVNGKIHGIEKWYYASGALEWETPFVNGKEHGIVKCYEAGKSNIDCLTLYEKGHEVTSVKFSIKGDRS